MIGNVHIVIAFIYKSLSLGLKLKQNMKLVPPFLLFFSFLSYQPFFSFLVQCDADITECAKAPKEKMAHRGIMDGGMEYNPHLR